MGSFSRLDVPIVFGSLLDRWFVVVKPSGFVAPLSRIHPSVEATLQPFCGDRKLSFPIKPEKDVEGLLIVATDDSIHRCFDDLVRRRLIRSIFRVLADVSSVTSPISVSAPPGLSFLGCDRLAGAALLGSLHEFGSHRLLPRGALRSYMSARPLKLATSSPADDRLRPFQGKESDRQLSSKPFRSNVDTGIASAWRSHKELREGLEGESVPSSLQGNLSKSLLSQSRSPQSHQAPIPLAVTEFELESGPSVCPTAPNLSTAIYLARARTTAAHQIRRHFADACCPVMFDPYYHPKYNSAIRKNVFCARSGSVSKGGASSNNLSGTLGLQLCELNLPDPYRSGQSLQISLNGAPSSWSRVHPRRDHLEELVDCSFISE